MIIPILKKKNLTFLGFLVSIAEGRFVEDGGRFDSSERVSKIDVLWIRLFLEFYFFKIGMIIKLFLIFP